MIKVENPVSFIPFLNNIKISLLYYLAYVDQ